MFLGSIFANFTKTWNGWSNNGSSRAGTIDNLPYWIRQDVGLEGDDEAVKDERRQLTNWTKYFQALSR